jgi:hypothetical protein
MAEYFYALQSNTLRLPLAGVVAMWCVLYLFAHALTRKQQTISKSHPQNFITTGEPTGRIREQSWRLVYCQVALTAVIFISARFVGGPAFVFLAGGWLVTTAVSIPLALRRILFQRALSAPGAASGSVTLSYIRFGCKERRLRAARRRGPSFNSRNLPFASGFAGRRIFHWNNWVRLSQKGAPNRTCKSRFEGMNIHARRHQSLKPWALAALVIGTSFVLILYLEKRQARTVAVDMEFMKVAKASERAFVAYRHKSSSVGIRELS